MRAADEGSRVGGDVAETQVLLVASSGGHLLELLELADEYPPATRHWVTFDKPDARVLLAGERDSVLSPATVRRAGEILGHARVEIVPGAPHSMYWETPSLFNDAVGRFLADVTAGSVTRG